MKLSITERILALTLLAYIVCDVLLTPLGGIETRDPARVTTVGIAALTLLFVGLALSIVALVLLFRGSERSSLVGIIAAVLYFPAFLTELTGHFSSLQAPIGIVRVELVQAVIAVIAMGLSFWVLRGGTGKTKSS